MPTGAHCSSCNIDYDRDFAKNLEASFRPAPGVRDVVSGQYCLFGRMSTPHIRLHITVEAGATREVKALLRPGNYRLRTLEQQVNASDLPDDVKVKLQGYVSGCYGSLTSFNVLFADDGDQFKGSAD